MRIPVGRVRGHRGNRGELTVAVASGNAGLWHDVSRVWIEPPGASYRVELSRSYSDRLVLKLEGIDDGNGAASLRGSRVSVARDAAPSLPSGTEFSIDLVGMEVFLESGLSLGRIQDVWPTGGTDLLVIVKDGCDEELLVPHAAEIVISIEGRGQTGKMCIRPPEGLLELNRSAGEPAGEAPGDPGEGEE